jgi:hypothetical protein
MAEPSVQITEASGTANKVKMTVALDDGGGQATCTAIVNGTRQSGTDCTGAPSYSYAHGSHSSSTHTLQIEVSNPAGTVLTEERAISTTTINGQIYFGCDEGMDTNYCSSANGIAIYGAANNNGDSIGRTHSRDRHKAYCWTTGELIRKGGQESDGNNDYHPGKNDSDKWIKIDYAANAYVPFVWINIDGVDKNSTGDLPSC